MSVLGLGIVPSLLLAPANHFRGPRSWSSVSACYGVSSGGQPHSWSMSLGRVSLLVDGSLGSKCTADLCRSDMIVVSKMMERQSLIE